MNNLSLSEKKQLLGLAKRLRVAIERRERFEQNANNVLKNSQITLRELGYPTTNASRNVVRRLARLENMIKYSQEHITHIAIQLMNRFPTMANMSPNKIILNATESIRRYTDALRNIHSGRYQTHGRRYS